jgi:predicted ATPase
MRVLELHLPRFKNLQDFSIQFDDQSSVSVLVGRNGTGKSNILEALTLIFRDLDLGFPATIDYTVKYVCRGKIIQVTGQAGRRGVDATVDGTSVPSNEIIGDGGRNNRPDFVFGYYSGPSNRLEEHFWEHQVRFYRALIRGDENPLRPLFYARAVHSNFVLLAFFVEEAPAIRTFLSEHLSIEQFDSALFEMQKPDWRSRKGDPRFWNAHGTVEDLLDRLYKVSLAPMRFQATVKIGMRRPTKNEHLFLFLPSLRALRSLRELYKTNQGFFKALESTYISELIFDVRVRVGLRKAQNALTFRELSEGEQQLLLVLGLMRFTKEDESLFLLDEPDTHLNPAWSIRYREFLEEIGGLGDTSHVLMATHDPLVVSSMAREEVRILERDSAGEIKPLLPLDDPRGMGVTNLLTSDVYGLPAAVDPSIYREIVRKRELAAKESLTTAEAAELAELATRLSDLGMLVEDTDPDFQEYLRARYRSSRADNSLETRTQEEVEADRRAAEELMLRILGQAPSKPDNEGRSNT